VAKSRGPKRSGTGKASRPSTTKSLEAQAKSKGSGASLMVMVPPETLRALRVQAAETGTTVRALVLAALSKAGYEVPADELIDRRRRT